MAIHADLDILFSVGLIDMGAAATVGEVAFHQESVRIRSASTDLGRYGARTRTGLIPVPQMCTASY